MLLAMSPVDRAAYLAARAQSYGTKMAGTNIRVTLKHPPPYAWAPPYTSDVWPPGPWGGYVNPPTPQARQRPRQLTPPSSPLPGRDPHSGRQQTNFLPLISPLASLR